MAGTSSNRGGPSQLSPNSGRRKKVEMKNRLVASLMFLVLGFAPSIRASSEFMYSDNIIICSPNVAEMMAKSSWSDLSEEAQKNVHEKIDFVLSRYNFDENI